MGGGVPCPCRDRHSAFALPWDTLEGADCSWALWTHGGMRSEWGYTRILPICHVLENSPSSCCVWGSWPVSGPTCWSRWDVAYPLSPRHVEALMEERWIDVDHSTINRWT